MTQNVHLLIFETLVKESYSLEISQQIKWMNYTSVRNPLQTRPKRPALLHQLQLAATIPRAHTHTHTHTATRNRSLIQGIIGNVVRN